MADYVQQNKGFKVQWTGFQEFQDLLDEIQTDYGPKDAKNILRNACRAAMTTVLQAARSNLERNIDTGQLIRSLQIEARKPNSKDKRSSYTSPTMIMISRVTVAPGTKFIPDGDGKKTKFTTKTFKNVKTGVKQNMHSDARAYAIEFGTARWLKGEGMPYMRPALENNAATVTNNLGYHLGTALEKYRSKNMKVPKT